MTKAEMIEQLAFPITASGCMEFQGATNGRGYGRVGYGSSVVYAHRYSYSVHHGHIAQGASVCHTCDNRICVNPEHLFLGTPLENMRDCAAKGRTQRGETHKHAKLSRSDVEQIIALRAAGMRNADISRLFSISQSQPSAILQRKEWRHVSRMVSV